MTMEILAHWIDERTKVAEAKKLGKDKPWTTDPILQKYRFCNVRRNDDTESKLIQNNWLHPYADHQNVEFAMCMARLINWWPTLNYIGFPAYWNPEFYKKMLHEWKASNGKVFTGAYIVSTNGKKKDKIDYIVDDVLDPIFGGLRKPTKNDTLKSYWEHLVTFDGLGSFMAAQVIADLKYIYPLREADDWWTWAALGPGSIRGLNRLAGRDINMHLTQEFGWNEMWLAYDEIKNGNRTVYDISDLTMQDFQNCLCEYDKYMRVLNGEGRPRSTYPGEK